jgi:hypothetical protein
VDTFFAVVNEDDGDGDGCSPSQKMALKLATWTCFKEVYNTGPKRREFFRMDLLRSMRAQCDPFSFIGSVLQDTADEFGEGEDESGVVRPPPPPSVPAARRHHPPTAIASAAAAIARCRHPPPAAATLTRSCAIVSSRQLLVRLCMPYLAAFNPPHRTHSALGVGLQVNVVAPPDGGGVEEDFGSAVTFLEDLLANLTMANLLKMDCEDITGGGPCELHDFCNNAENAVNAWRHTGEAWAQSPAACSSPPRLRHRCVRSTTTAVTAATTSATAPQRLLPSPV